MQNATNAAWTSETCQLGAINIHYSRTGHTKPSLMALHGLTGSGACWTPVARTLADEYDVVMPDARGHGASGAPAQGYLYRDQANDVLGLIGALGLSAPVLLGHSMGGLTAAVAASQSGSALRGVILADPTFIGPERQREVYQSGVAEQHRQLLKLEKSEVLTQLRLRSPHRSTEMLELLAEARLQTRLEAFEVLTPPNPDYRELIEGLCIPILLILGEKGIVTLETARELQRLNPRLRYELMPGVGHGLVYDQPEGLGTIVKHFLRSLPPLDTVGESHSRA